MDVTMSIIVICTVALGYFEAGIVTFRVITVILRRFYSTNTPIPVAHLTEVILMSHEQSLLQLPSSGIVVFRTILTTLKVHRHVTIFFEVEASLGKYPLFGGTNPD